MAIYQVNDIDERWNEQMLAIEQEAPIEADGLKILFDQSPDPFFLPRLRSSALRCGGFFIRNQLSGFAMMLQKEVFLDRHPQKVLYFCNLVAGKNARGTGMLYRMSDFFLNDLPPDIRLGYAVIMKSNHAARRLVNRVHSRFSNMPRAKVIGEWRAKTILLLPSLPFKPKYIVRRACFEDLDRIVDLLHREYQSRMFGPVICKEHILLNIKRLPGFSIKNYYVIDVNEELIGVCCAWDMAPVKRNRVLAYGSKFRRIQLLIKLVGPLVRFPKLPTEGEPFRATTILDYAVRDRNPEIMRALLTAIYHHYRKRRYHMIVFGYPAGDPLGNAANPFLSSEVTSEIVVFSKSKQLVDEFRMTSLPYIDMALL